MLVLDYIQSGELYHGENLVGHDDVLNRPLKQLVDGLANGEADVKAKNIIFNVDSAVDFEATVVDSDLVIYDTAIDKFRKYEYGTDDIQNIILGFADVTKALVVIKGFYDIFSGLVEGEKYYADVAGGLTTTPNDIYVGMATNVNTLFVDIMPNVYSTDSLTLEGNAGSFYLDWNNFTNIPEYIDGAREGIFYENEQVVSASYTITAGKNAMTAGDITIADGVTVTVPDGSRWTIV